MHCLCLIESGTTAACRHEAHSIHNSAATVEARYLYSCAKSVLPELGNVSSVTWQTLHCCREGCREGDRPACVVSARTDEGNRTPRLYDTVSPCPIRSVGVSRSCATLCSKRSCIDSHTAYTVIGDSDVPYLASSSGAFCDPLGVPLVSKASGSRSV